MSAHRPAKIIQIGVGGGIAAFKSALVVSELVKQGLEVHVAMTPAACRFITPLTFEALTGNPVRNSIFPDQPPGDRKAAYPHLYPASQASLFAVVPATANLIAKLAAGLGDDIVSLSALSLGSGCQRLLCPAMNVEMWQQPVVQNNVGHLKQLGWQVIGPQAGHLACGMQGLGRLSEPATIVDAVTDALQDQTLLKGKKILIFSGPTREAIDPVRFISNHSSGKMGYALAQTAARMGGQVTLVTGPIAESLVPAGPAIQVHKVNPADAMLAAGKKYFKQADIVVFAAAVADYTPASPRKEKVSKTGQPLHLDLKPTVDIARTLCARKRKGQITIGFALETHEGLTKARKKLKNKNLDAIVLNGVESLGQDFGSYQLLLKGKRPGTFPLGTLTKHSLATALFKEAALIQ